jgi:hypothetical protein
MHVVIVNTLLENGVTFRFGKHGDDLKHAIYVFCRTMSSHHIVRDNQEPALLLVDVSESGFAFIQELLKMVPY